MKLAIIAFALLDAVLASPIQQMPRADTPAERQDWMDFRPDRDPSPSAWFDDYIDRADAPAERQIKWANGE